MRIQEVESVLKNIYLDIFQTQLNNFNPFYASIRKSTDKVRGKEIVHYVNCEEVRTPLQNLYCTIEIPRKAIDSCSAGTLVNIINEQTSDTICKHKESMHKALWAGGEAEIYSIPHLIKNATVIKDESQISNTLIHKMLDKIEEASGEQPNMILSSYGQKRAYTTYLTDTRTNIDYMTLDGGYKALSCNGIPFIAEKYLASNNIYFIDTKDFEMQQLCDWLWLENDSGRILRENGKNYTATLVKYANLICLNPQAQGILEDYE